MDSTISTVKATLLFILGFLLIFAMADIAYLLSTGVQQAQAGGSCDCNVTNPAPPAECSFDPQPNSNCSLDTTATNTMCQGGSSPTCSCECVDSSAPGAPGLYIPGLDPDPANLHSFPEFQYWLSLIQKYLVAFGVMVSLLILPYVGVLWASGDPKNIEKATEWFKALIFGLALLLLSGAILKFVGTDILGL